MSYRKGVKKKALRGLPKFSYSILLSDKSTDPPTLTEQDNLHAIPARYLNLRSGGNLVLLRQEGRTTLQEIKRFHKRVLLSKGRSEEVFRDQCRNLDFSLDGVREAAHAQRTLLIVSVRFGRSRIYVLRVYNPLVGYPEAQPNVEKALG